MWLFELETFFETESKTTKNAVAKNSTTDSVVLFKRKVLHSSKKYMPLLLVNNKKGTVTIYDQQKS